MSATSALAAAPSEPEVEMKIEPEAAREVAVEAAAEPGQEPKAQPPDMAEPVRERIFKAETLPVAMRDRLASVAAASGEGKLPVEEVVKAIEESLPEFLRTNRAGTAQPQHPAGEAFFRGDSESLSDEEATQIAQRQLARSGLLRGQRVRVAD